MILSDELIRKAVNEGSIKIEPFNEKQIEPASYDLTVGDQAISAKSDNIINIKEKGFFELEPGGFGIILIAESVEFDASHLARIGLRSKYSRKGIIATTGPQIDPGFKGKLKIGVANLTPKIITFSHGDDLVTIEIHKLQEPSKKPYQGPYQGIEKLTAEDIEAVKDREGMTFSEMRESLLSLSKNVGQLSKNVGKLEVNASWIKWFLGVCFSVILAMFIFIFQKL